MGYDLSQIMKDAWEIVKTANITMKEALKMAWNLAKGIVSVRERDCEEDGSVSVNFWFNYGKARAYFKRNWVSKFQNSKNYYIDLLTGEIRL